MIRFILIFSIIPLIANAQNNTQNIRGIVTDKFSQSLLVGVKIQITSLQKATTTDALGKYTLKDISPGRYELIVSFAGYKSITIPNIAIVIN